MAWFKKQKENASEVPELSELPQLPRLPELPEANELSPTFNKNVKEELPVLPDFSESESGENVINHVTNEKMIKPYTMEIESSGRKEVKLGKFAREVRTREVQKPTFPTASVEREKQEPIFVRIDKFQAAVQNFDEIKRQIAKIESYLSEIREIKAKEENEISEWEKEIQEIKTKLENIDRGVFSKLD